MNTRTNMNTRHNLYLLLAFSMMGSAHAAIFVNTGDTGTSAGVGPEGADANYLVYTTAHENAATGQLTTFNGVSFAEGGLAGTYDVGVAFTWLDAQNNNTKQAFSGRTNNRGHPEFWTSWVGVDSRTAQGGIGGTDRMQLNLTGLAANQSYVFTSYHGDTHDQEATFTVDQTPTSSETATSPFAFTRLSNHNTADYDPWIENAYSFDVTSDGSGNLDITFARDAGGDFFGINGFNLVAVPEPSAGLLVAFAASALLLRRRA